MAANKVNDGNVIQWTNGGADVASGDLVNVGVLVGVAVTDIAGGETGALALVGVYTVPKVTGEAWVQGDLLAFDASTDSFDKTITPATGDIANAGVAWADAASADATGQVLLRPGTSVT